MRYAELNRAITEARSNDNVIMTEAQVQNWLQRNWRPPLMLVIIVIVASNYILYQYLSIFTDKVRVLDLPDRLCTLMEIGVGGYILGRTAEKIRGGSEFCGQEGPESRKNKFVPFPHELPFAISN